MIYCTLADIETPQQDLIELTDDNDLGIIDQTVIDKAIAAAGELIDGYLRGRYTLPLNPVPGLLPPLAAVIALRRLYGRRPRLAVPESLADEYKNCLKTLDLISSGRISLGSEAVTGAIAPESGGVQTSSPDRVFTRDTLRDY